jgi:hypothetical protein
MSQINVTTIRNRTGGPPALDKGVVVTGCTTSTSGYFSGNVTIGGTLTHEDVTNIDSVGVVTARGGFLAGNPAVSIGATITAAGAASFSGIVTANTISATTGTYSGTVTGNEFEGSGAKLTGLPAGWNWVDGSLF